MTAMFDGYGNRIPIRKSRAPQPDLALVAGMLDSLANPGFVKFNPDAIREQARLCREADNAAAARIGTTVLPATPTVTTDGGVSPHWSQQLIADSDASPAEQVGEDGLLLAVVGRAHFGNPIPAEWYAAARDLIRRLATPEQPEGKGADDLLRRIDAAIERITSGRGEMRIPADNTDPDLVLADAGNWIKNAAAPVGVDELLEQLRRELSEDKGWDYTEYEKGRIAEKERCISLLAALAGKERA